MSKPPIVERVMVACVTDEVVKIVNPAEVLRIERTHLLNYVKKAKSNKENEIARENLYEDIYQEVYRGVSCICDEIIPHRNVEVYKFDECFHAVYDILVEESKLGSIIYVNISGGTPEYAAAASIASMMIEGVKLFSVGVTKDGHTIPYKDLKETLMHDGKLVGSAFEIYEPFEIDKFPLDTPDIESLKALKVFMSISLNQRSNVNVIRELIHRRLWKYGSSNIAPTEGTSVELEDDQGHCIGSQGEYSRRQRKEAVQYQRGYIDLWKERYGWIKKSELNGKRYDLTMKGERYLMIFCSDVVYKL